MLRRAGRAKQAREPLRDALDLAHRCECPRLAQRAGEELAATGVRRVDRALLSGAESLTPTELRIARMAAAGTSNPDIANALFVTRKTVEFHLSRVYRKLAIRSRDELPAALSPTNGRGEKRT